MLLKSRSYSERSNWVEMLTSIGVLYYYLHKIPFLPGSFETHPAEFGELLIKVIFASIILAIIYSIVFGLGAGNSLSKEDERDLQCRQKAATWAFWLMYAGVVFLIVQLFINSWIVNFNNGDSSTGGLFISIPPTDFLLHGLIILCFISQITQNLSEIILQRRGI